MSEPNFSKYVEDDHDPPLYEYVGQIQAKYELMRELLKIRKWVKYGKKTEKITKKIGSLSKIYKWKDTIKLMIFPQMKKGGLEV